MNKITDKVKRLIGHNSFRELCSYSYMARKQTAKKKIDIAERMSGKETKRRIVWYAGRLSTNGMTTSLCNLIKGVGDDTYEHLVLVLGADKEELKKKQSLFGTKVQLIAFDGIKPTFSEVGVRGMYFMHPKDRSGTFQTLERMYQRNARELFGELQPDVVIQFTGYDRDVIGLFAMADCKKVIFAHNDKLAEIQLVNGEDAIFLKHFLPQYDHVACVTTDIAQGLDQLGVSEQQIHIVNNPHDDNKVKQAALEPIAFEADTRCELSAEQLSERLERTGETFITIGRFVPQKGHDILLKALKKYHKDHPETDLIIIGGYGELYESTKNLAKELGLSDHVILIRQIKNPMPILKRCQLFILSSLFEGQGLVLFEAASLGIPLFSTDVNGPRGFMTEYGGTLVEPTEEGVYQGMLEYRAGTVKQLVIDFEEYNRGCLQAMRELL